jgi:hypothetical protein
LIWALGRTDRRACAPAATLRYIGQARDVTLSLSCDCGTRHRPAGCVTSPPPTESVCARSLTPPAIEPRRRSEIVYLLSIDWLHAPFFSPKNAKFRGASSATGKTGRVGTPPFFATPARFTAACLAFLVCNFWPGNIFITLVAADIAPCFMQPQFTLF